MITIKLNLYEEEQEVTADEHVLCYIRNMLMAASSWNELAGYTSTAAENRAVAKDIHNALKESGF